MIFTTKIREYRCQAKPDKKKIAFSEKKITAPRLRL